MQAVRILTKPEKDGELILKDLPVRVGKFRVFYDVDNQMRIVSIEAIGLKIGSSVFFRGKEREL